MANPSAITITDGSIDFSGGVDSIKVTTIQSQTNPHGLSRNELAWLNNGTVRDGGITIRTGWKELGKVHDGGKLYQGGFLYEPTSGTPYLILSIGGRLYQFDPNTANTVDLSKQFGLTNSDQVDQCFFCQAQQFLVQQTGDFTTNPLIWDGATLRRSKGITNAAVPPGTPGVNEIPAGGPMDFYMQRLWWANDNMYSAGDIYGGPSGVLSPTRADAVLNVTENPLVLGGDGFSVPSTSGKIRSLFHNANLNAPLGQGQLFIGTRKQIYSQQVPVTRTDWIAATSNNQPQQNVVQINNGTVNDRSVVKANGDIFYQSLEPGIRSLFASVRNFGQWGNVDIAANENRILQFNNRALLRFASGINFDNRMLQTALPFVSSVGVAHQALIPMDFIPISGFQQAVGPVWEGMYEGVDILQLFVGDFGGLERAFAAVVSRVDGSIQVWELTNSDRFEGGDKRNTMIIEFPAYTFGSEFDMKRLVGGEIWVDKVYGDLEWQLDYRVDSDPCWIEWNKWKACVARSSCEDVNNPICYPLVPYREGYKATMTMPKPPAGIAALTRRPSDLGYQFQPRLIQKGWARIRGLRLFASPFDKPLYGAQTMVGPGL